MSNAITVMKRVEFKYILSKEQTDYLIEHLKGHMEVDQYGLTSIASLYYDTPDYRLIRTSIEKPKFKEKIRLRSYGLATENSNVYLELKRKYDGIVYKRRAETTIPAVKAFFNGEGDICANGQIAKEIAYFRDYYKNLVPSCLIIYDRTAYIEKEGDLRLTIDARPRYRVEDLVLTKDMEGIPLLPEGCCILEVKVQQALPLWLIRIFKEANIKINTFSKYGEAYKQQMNKLVSERIINYV